jgi:glycosyltransferase involved in cell wall biosynthesis
MRVLHVIPSVSERSGGPATAIIPMCKALQERGTEVLLVTTNAGLQDIETSNGLASSHNGVPTMIFPTKWGTSFKYSGRLAAWLNENVRDFDLVHIHAVFNHACIAAAHACRKRGVPYVVRPLGTLDPWSMKQKPLRKRLFWLISGRQMLQGAAAVHYTASTEQNVTEELLGLNHGKVVPLGVDEKFAALSARTNELARNFPSLAGQSYVLALSRLHPKKGLDILIDAFLSLVKVPGFERWRLVIAGDGPADHVALLKKRIAASDVGDKVMFTGWLDGERKEAVLCGAALLALPSYQENFGLCVLEALACGVPVLVSPHVNLAEAIEISKAGWIAEVDKRTLEEKLAEALGDEDERSRRGHAGRLLSQNYSWSNVAHGLADLYSAIVGQTAGQVVN